MARSICLFIIFLLFITVKMFAGPFGIDFGMSLEQIRQISSTTPQNVEDDIYLITPPNTHELFEFYIVQIHPTHGVYFIKAISRDINTNRHGTELVARFNSLVSNIERTYGNYLRIDEIKPESLYRESQWFMTALERGDRELAALWSRRESSRLPEDISEIIIAASATRFSTSRGFIVIEYYSINYDIIEEERASVF